MATQPTFTLNFMGDVMLGRLIDQLFPEHVPEVQEARIAHSFVHSHPQLKNYGPTTPWGNTLPLLQSADLNLINLETSVTTYPRKWPNKVFNYRMHPANISALKAAGIDYAGLANNHTLDFSEPGLLETVQTVREAGIAFAGAGETREEATRPAVLKLEAQNGKQHEIHIWAAADHPGDWPIVPSFHFIDYSHATRQRLKTLITAPSSSQAVLKIFSVHWGPNYSWRPADEIRDLAHFLIDECGIDIIHGHSSHHVQGVEKYKGKLIIYGCGDFVDDYAVNEEFRNDLSAVWQVRVTEEGEEILKVRQLRVIPTRIEKFVARRLGAEEGDNCFVRDKIKMLSQEMGTRSKVEGDGSLVVDLKS
jgi:poly-gamma-glutamate capsule biosynthesis protein CapA/YwtB (metallophosphatase superfamily)